MYAVQVGVKLPSLEHSAQRKSQTLSAYQLFVLICVEIFVLSRSLLIIGVAKPCINWL